MVPVLRNTHTKTLAEISAEIKNLTAKARDGKLTTDDMSGGTFTISNLGMFGVEYCTPIINQPEVAILGINSMADTPVVVDGQVVIRPIMKFSLTADHRAVDGAVAAQFLSLLKKYLEKPIIMLMS
jgi:pyruvate dehydrogenase E2 component (dihydrolipoamide acetyltransferase)